MREDNMLTIIVPCYNEEEVLPETVKELGAVLESMISEEQVSSNSKLLFVDDGSKDKTWELIKKFENQFVYGVRNNRDTDTAFKRKTAMAFYSLMSKLGVDMVPNSADYRLLSKRATEGLLRFDERNLFLRGMVPLVGYPSDKVYYARKERFAGESKYPLKKMIKFAMDGITSFSTVPIKLIMNLGLLVVLIGIGLFIYSIVQKINGNVVSGWTSLITSIWVLGGIQLICLSMIGEYVGKIFTEVKKRPRFTIQEDDYTKEFLK